MNTFGLLLPQFVPFIFIFVHELRLILKQFNSSAVNFDNGNKRKALALIVREDRYNFLLCCQNDTNDLNNREHGVESATGQLINNKHPPRGKDFFFSLSPL